MYSAEKKRIINASIYEIEKRLNKSYMGINPEMSHEGFEDCLYSILCYVNDLLVAVCDENKCSKKVCKCGNRIVFTDDVIIERKVYDITSLIAHFRNYLVGHRHQEQVLDETGFRARFMLASNSEGTIEAGDGHVIRIDYKDDLAIINGRQRLYYKRHLLRVYNEAKSYFSGKI